MPVPCSNIEEAREKTYNNMAHCSIQAGMRMVGVGWFYLLCTICIVGSFFNWTIIRTMDGMFFDK